MGSSEKERYRAFCEVDDEVSIFCKDWWLDAIYSPGNWDVVLAEKEGSICGYLPYAITRGRYGLTRIRMPSLTQTLGVGLRYPQRQKRTTRLAYEKEIMIHLIDNLPAVDLFSQNFHFTMTNVLPFLWSGFTATVRYSYVLDTSDLQQVWGDLQGNIRTDVRKAGKQLVVDCTPDLDAFLEINRMTFARQSQVLPYSTELVRRIDIACAEHHARRMLFARDAAGRVHAAVYLIWDGKFVYYLLGGGNPELRSSGATSLLLWEAIKFAASLTRQFDFEGSMIEPIERFFRAFGARQVAYYNVMSMSRRMKILWHGRNMLDVILGLS